MKGLKPKNKGHTNFHECCDLTKKVYLVPGDFEHFVAAHPLAAAGLMPEDVSDDWIYNQKNMYKPPFQSKLNIFVHIDLNYMD